MAHRCSRYWRSPICTSPATGLRPHDAYGAKRPHVRPATSPTSLSQAHFDAPVDRNIALLRGSLGRLYDIYKAYPNFVGSYMEAPSGSIRWLDLRTPSHLDINEWRWGEKIR